MQTVTVDFPVFSHVGVVFNTEVCLPRLSRALQVMMIHVGRPIHCQFPAHRSERVLHERKRAMLEARRRDFCYNGGCVYMVI